MRHIPKLSILAGVSMLVVVAVSCAGIGDDSDEPSRSATEAADQTQIGSPTPATVNTTTPTLTPTDSSTATATATAQLANLEDIGAAYDEAAVYPRTVDPQPADLPRPFMEEHPGSSDRVCVEVDPENEDQRDWRSGEFITGNFWIYLQEWPDDHDWGKLYWNPLHAEEADDQNFLVRATLLNDPSGNPPAEVMRRKFTVFGISYTDEPDPTIFFASQIQLPTSGTWMLVATSGPDWGCFLLSLPETAS